MEVRFSFKNALFYVFLGIHPHQAGDKIIIFVEDKLCLGN